MSGAAPGAQVTLAYSTTGAGPYETPYGSALLTPPITQFTRPADAEGNLSLTLLCPDQPGQHIWVQAYDQQAGVFTNGWDGVIE